MVAAKEQARSLRDKKKDYTVDWLLSIGEFKNDPTCLAQMLDCLRTNDSKEEPLRLPPPPLAAFDRRHGASPALSGDVK